VAGPLSTQIAPTGNGGRRASSSRRGASQENVTASPIRVRVVEREPGHGTQRVERGVGVAQLPAGFRHHDGIALQRVRHRLGAATRRYEAQQLAGADPQGGTQPSSAGAEIVLCRDASELVEHLGLLGGLIEPGRAPQRRRRPALHHTAQQKVPAHRLA
jgi:hypothetical protein